MKIALITGGFSEERSESRETGKHIAASLERLGHSVVTLEYDENLLAELKRYSPDVAIPYVQGKNHGDGAVQALLELAKVKYTGSRPYAAAIINHKTVCKRIWRAADILTPDFFEYGESEYRRNTFADFAVKTAANGLSLPVVVKAPTQGSRYGIVFVKDGAGFAKLNDVFKFDDTALVEQYVPGRFCTQGIVEIDGVMTALAPIEILDDSGEEFELYCSDSAVRAHGLPSGQPDETSIFAAELVGAGGFARLDYHLSGGKLYLLEINAFPGLTPDYSTMHISAEYAGYAYDEFIALLLGTAK